ncbi:hypothetical protein TCAL_15273 [Tigriopus californicus]|uniref:Uncharacterized protein n=1 Tax=Tigriopus californicus TaxID=6832 RepID=A0A553NFP1_TIGCA|nr:hypothetical protein TCAL_15273 [Tigriopus californicus]
MVECLKAGVAFEELPPDHPGRLYSELWSFLAVEKGLIIAHSSQILIPASARKLILDLLHTSHQGRDRTLCRAKQLYLWRAMPLDTKVDPMVRSLAEEKRDKVNLTQKWQYDERARDLEPLGIGVKVRVQDASTHLWDRLGTINGICDGHGGRSYEISSQGRILLRNRRMLKPYHTIEGEDSNSSCSTKLQLSKGFGCDRPKRNCRSPIRYPDLESKRRGM